MNPQFIKWKARMNHATENNSDFERWIFIHLSAVLFAGKAGELFSLKVGLFGLRVDVQLRQIDVLSSMWNCSYRVLCRSLSCVKVVIYHPEKVKKSLSELPPWVFDAMGYPYNVEPGDFLEEIGKRWQEKKAIPHEVGLALGYPIKDVLGYMGLVPLPCTGMCGWRIHGDPRPSLCISRRYKRARQRVEAFLQEPAA
jgi:hypothetical protein